MNLIIIPNLIKLICKSGMNQIKLGMMMNGMGLTRRERGERQMVMRRASKAQHIHRDRHSNADETANSTADRSGISLKSCFSCDCFSEAG